MSKNKPDAANRRNFIKLAVATGGAATVAGSGVVSAALPEQEEVAVAPEKEQKGYRLTAHVQEYYNKARF